MTNVNILDSFKVVTECAFCCDLFYDQTPTGRPMYRLHLTSASKLSQKVVTKIMTHVPANNWECLFCFRVEFQHRVRECESATRPFWSHWLTGMNTNDRASRCNRWLRQPSIEFESINMRFEQIICRPQIKTETCWKFRLKDLQVLIAFDCFAFNPNSHWCASLSSLWKDILYWMFSLIPEAWCVSEIPFPHPPRKEKMHSTSQT